jgi:hypothetical protein
MLRGDLAERPIILDLGSDKGRRFGLDERHGVELMWSTMLKTKSNFYKSSVYANCALLRVATSAQKVAVRLGRRWKTVVLGTSALSRSEASHGKPCQPRLGSVGLLAATRGIAGAFEYAYRLHPPPLPKPRTGRDSRMALHGQDGSIQGAELLRRGLYRAQTRADNARDTESILGPRLISK